MPHAKIYEHMHVNIIWARSKLEISVIIPTLNEAENIQSLIEEIEDTCTKNDIKLEIVVVDDDSQDGTAEIAENANKFYGNIKVMRTIGHLGIGTAIIVGASIASYDVLVMMDADFSHPPGHIIKLVKGISEVDMVVCSRYVKGGRMEASLSRFLLSWLGNRLARFLLRSRVHDLTGGFQAVRKNVLRRVRLTSIYGEYSMELITKLQRMGFKIAEIPFVYKFRSRGQSKTHLAKASLWYLWTVLRLLIF